MNILYMCFCAFSNMKKCYKHSKIKDLWKIKVWLRSHKKLLRYLVIYGIINIEIRKITYFHKFGIHIWWLDIWMGFNIKYIKNNKVSINGIWISMSIWVFLLCLYYQLCISFFTYIPIMCFFFTILLKVVLRGTKEGDKLWIR